MAKKALSVAYEEFGDGSVVDDAIANENLKVYLPRTPMVGNKHPLTELDLTEPEAKKSKADPGVSLLYSILSGKEDTCAVRLRSRLCPPKPPKTALLMRAPLMSAPRRKMRKRTVPLKENVINCSFVRPIPPPVSQSYSGDTTAAFHWLMSTVWGHLLCNPSDPTQHCCTDEPLDLSRSSQKKTENIFTSIQRLAANDPIQSRVKLGGCINASSSWNPGPIMRSNNCSFTGSLPLQSAPAQPISSQSLNQFGALSFDALVTSAAYAKLMQDCKVNYPIPMLVKPNISCNPPLLPFLPIMKT